MSERLVTNWRELRAGHHVRILDPLLGVPEGTVRRVEPCKAADSAWAYVENGGPIEEMVLLIDGHPPKLAWASEEAPTWPPVEDERKEDFSR